MSLIKNVVNEENVGKICRICLEEKSENVGLRSLVQFEEVPIISLTIAEIVEKITGIKPLGQFLEVELICHDCVIEMKVSYLFMLKFHEGNKLLVDFMARRVKIEEERPITRPKRCKRKARRRNVTEKAIEHPKVVMHSCPICTKEFTALDLRDHAHTHKALRKYLSIPSTSMVPAWGKFCVKSEEAKPGGLFARAVKYHICPYCNEEFQVNEFHQHVNVHRTQNEYKCDKCSRVFKRINHLNTHRVKHLKEYPYKCEKCNKGFVIKRNYDCHILTHTNLELPHECKFCFKRFSNPEHLNRHQIIHTENVTYSVKYKVCKCSHCLKSFKDKAELQLHKCEPLAKLSNKRFPCKSCKKVFNQATSLYNHIRNIHKLKSVKTLCSVCGHYVANIYNHMMRHNGEKPYQCPQCEKRFIAKPQLKQHLLVHSGLKPYVCSVCAKAFNNLYNLQVHERIHKGDRCHICTICNKGFLEKSYLKKHMNVHAK